MTQIALGGSSSKGVRGTNKGTPDGSDGEGGELAMGELREKIAKLGQAEFGYVDWEQETIDTKRRWHEVAHQILAAVLEHMARVERPENPHHLAGEYREYALFSQGVQAGYKAIEESLKGEME